MPETHFIQSSLRHMRDWSNTTSARESLVKVFSIFARIVGSTTHTHTHFVPLSGTTRVSRYQKGKTNLDFTGARDSEWQWHQVGMCKSTPRSRQITTPAPHQARCPSCHPTNSVIALKAQHWRFYNIIHLISLTNECLLSTEQQLLHCLYSQNNYMEMIKTRFKL